VEEDLVEVEMVEEDLLQVGVVMAKIDIWANLAR